MPIERTIKDINKLNSGLPREAISLDSMREHESNSTPGSNSKNTNEASKYSLPKKFEILGSAHNISEINIKKLQGCSKIFLSPIFKSKKNQKFLSTIKFNLTTMTEDVDFIALGGINKNNYKKLRLTKVVGFAGISWIKKNGLRELRPFLKI